MKKTLLSIVSLFIGFFCYAQCPAVYTVSGGGTYCGTSPVTLSLSGSDTTASYQLVYVNSGTEVSYGSPLTGTGSSLSWVLPTDALYSGSYFKVLATYGSCTMHMADSALMTRGIPSAFATPIAICLHDSVYIVDSIAGGTWSSSDPAIASVISYGGAGSGWALVVCSSVGRAALTYAITSSCGTGVVTDSVFVSSATPHATIAGPSSLCYGSVATYTASGTSAASGAWSSSSPSVATIDAIFGTMTALSAGTITVSYISTTACGSDTAVQTVTVSSASGSGAVISGPFALHMFDTATYRVSGASGGTWSVSPSSLAAVSSSGLLTASHYYSTVDLAYTYTAGCGSAVAHYAIDITDYSSLISDSFYVRRVMNCNNIGLEFITPYFDTLKRIYIDFGDGATSLDTFVALGIRGASYISHVYSATGPFNIHYRLYNGVAIDSLQDSIYVAFPVPVTVSGPLNDTVGIPTTLTTSGSGGYWYSNYPSVAYVSSSGIVSGISPGYTNITYGTSASIPAGYSISSCYSYAYQSITVVTQFGGIRDSIWGCALPTCGGGLFYAGSNLSGTSSNIITYFGDGTYSIRPTTGYPYYDTFTHDFPSSGTYTIKQYLLETGRSTPTDSVIYSFRYVSCRDFSIASFWDVDSNCVYDASTDYLNGLPVSVIIDSNGVTIDTVSITTGLYYHAYGSPGTVYSYHISLPGAISCFSTINDTLIAGVSTVTKYFPLKWVLRSGYDLSASHIVSGPGRHGIIGDIDVSNSDTASAAIVRLDFDPRYNFASSSPSPGSVTSHTATWYLGSVVPGATPVHISYHLEVPSGTSHWLIPGDTVASTVMVGPNTGDLDTVNNVVVRVDTVKLAWDPNFVYVTPQSNILNGTKLHYTVHFENDGNAAATNIYILDTLSDNVDPSTVQIETATSAMYVSYLHYSGHTVLKFDFPGINLPDSTHHDQCTGFVTFNIKARRGLSDGTLINDRAGIYFDYNPVVITNTVTNTIIVPSVSIVSATGDSSCAGDTARFTANPHSVSNTHYQWYIGTTPAGTDNIHFNTTSLTTGSNVICKMTAIQDTSVSVFSSAVTMSVFRHLTVTPISGVLSICVGAATILNDTTASGTWHSVAGHGSITATGAVSGVSAGIDTFTYIVSNYCGSAIARHTMTILPTTSVSDSITVTRDSLCSGDTVTFSAMPTNGGTAPLFYWRVFGGIVDSGSSFTYMPSLGDIVTCQMSSNVTCPMPATATSNSIYMYVVPSVTPSISVVPSPSDSIFYYGQLINFYATVSYGGTVTTYQWYSDHTAIPGATSSSYSAAFNSNDTLYCVMTSNAPCATTTTAVSNSIVIYGDYLGVHEIASRNTGYSLFPNPNTGSLTITGGAAGNSLVNYEITDIIGKVLTIGAIQPENGVINCTLSLDNSIAPGSYYIRIHTGDGIVVMPFVKQ